MDSASDISADATLIQRRAQDASLPIAHLPVELLCNAFLSLDVRDRILASAVCRHWRDVAVTCAALWATLNNTVYNFSVDAFLVFFSRSKDTGLYVAWDMDAFSHAHDRGRLLELVVALRRNLHRVRDLRLKCDEDALVFLLNKSDAPRLMQLHLNIRLDSSPWTSDAEEPSLSDAILRSPINLSRIKVLCPQLRILSVATQSERDSQPGSPAAIAHVDEHVDLSFDSLDLLGDPAWIGSALAHVRSSAHVVVQAFPLTWALVEELSNMGTIDELALVNDSEFQLGVAARSGTRTRTLWDRSSFKFRDESDLPARVLPLATWTSGLVSLTIFQSDWWAVTPAPAPVLRHLTVMLDATIEVGENDTSIEQDAELYSDSNVFQWRCPALTTVTLAFGWYNGRHDAATLPENRLIVFLRDMLCFDHVSKLALLSLVNVALVDADKAYLGLKAQRGSALRVTDAFRLVESITMQIDKGFSGMPTWCENGLVSL